MESVSHFSRIMLLIRVFEFDTAEVGRACCMNWPKE